MHTIISIVIDNGYRFYIIHEIFLIYNIDFKYVFVYLLNHS